MAMRVWGVSRLRDLRVCPAMFVCKYENKQAWVETPNPQMERGSKVHKGLEEAINYDVVLDDREYGSVVPFVDSLQQMKHDGTAIVIAEHKFGMNIAYQKVDFFRAANLRVRLALDVYVNMNAKLLLIDWKTGRFKPEHQEDALFYGAFTEIGQAGRDTTVQYVYLDEPQNTFAVHIDDSNALVRKYYADFEEADEYLDKWKGKEPVNPGRQCNWCGNVACPKNTNDKAKMLAQQTAAGQALLFKGGA